MLEIMKGRAKESTDGEGTRHKRLTLSFPHLMVEDLMCPFIGNIT